MMRQGAARQQAQQAAAPRAAKVQLNTHALAAPAQQDQVDATLPEHLQHKFDMRTQPNGPVTGDPWWHVLPAFVPLAQLQVGNSASLRHRDSE